MPANFREWFNLFFFLQFNYIIPDIENYKMVMNTDCRLPDDHGIFIIDIL